VVGRLVRGARAHLVCRGPILRGSATSRARAHVSTQCVTGAAGLAALLAWVLGYAFGVGLPGADATPSQLAAYATDHGIELELFGVMLSVGGTLLLVFQVGLSQILRAADASLRTLATTGLVGGVASQTLVIVGCALIQVQVLEADPLTAALAPYSNTIAYLVFAFSAWPTVLMLCAYGLAIQRAAGFSLASSLLAFAAAVLHAGAALSLARGGTWSMSGPISESAPLVLFLWIACVSIELLVRRRLRGVPLPIAPST
jgi:hypothetical protein